MADSEQRTFVVAPASRIGLGVLLLLAQLIGRAALASTVRYPVVCEDGVAIHGKTASCDEDGTSNGRCDVTLHVPRGGSIGDVALHVGVSRRRVFWTAERFTERRYTVRCVRPPRQRLERVAKLDGHRLGFASAIAATRDHIAVGAPGDHSVGAVEIYDRASLRETAELVSPASEPDLFGASIAADDSDFLVGAPLAGTIYRIGPDGHIEATINRPDRAAESIGSDDAGFGSAIATSLGRLAVVSRHASADPDPDNTLHVLDARSGKVLWQSRLSPTTFPPSVTTFGRRVVVSAGACRGVRSVSSCVVVFDIRNGAILLEIPTPDVTGRELFGVSLSLGKILVVGSPEDGAGSAYAFDPRSGRVLHHYHRGPTATAPDDLSFFGVRVFASDQWVGVVDPRDHFDLGSVYVYERRRGRFMQRIDGRSDCDYYGVGFARYAGTTFITSQDYSCGGYVDVIRTGNRGMR